MLDRLITLLPAPIRMRLIGNLLREHALCLLLKPRRLTLPVVFLERLIPGFQQAAITLRKRPMGSWASPVVDIVTMAKIARFLQPQRVLEVGSVRGYTALAMAQNLGDEGKIVALDIEPSYGEAYRDSPDYEKIEPRTSRRSAWECDAKSEVDLAVQKTQVLSGKAVWDVEISRP